MCQTFEADHVHVLFGCTATAHSPSASLQQLGPAYPSSHAQAPPEQGEPQPGGMKTEGVTVSQPEGPRKEQGR